ncbi:MAG: hypothetical protein IJ019_00835 [Alphaproteobacteria bacterium]|nr:hypothetical protein [Alphaproteobacteria bacterium]
MKFESLKGIRLQGIAKSIHKFFLMITYPFRHSFKFLGFLVVGIVLFAAIPMIQGVSYKHVFDWYMLRYDEVKNDKSEVLQQKPEPVERKLKNSYKKELKLRKAQSKNNSLTVYSKQDFENQKSVKASKKIKRKTFKLKTSPFRHVNVKNTWTKKKDIIKEKHNVKTMVSVESVSEPLIENQAVEIVAMPKVKDELIYRKIDTLELTYEEKPEHIKGKALVFSANDLSVGDRYIILYGIYTDEKKYDAKGAFEYLKDLADKKEVECDIVAYTYQHYATAVCFIDGKSINQNLVDAGFADNIAL